MLLVPYFLAKYVQDPTRLITYAVAYSFLSLALRVSVAICTQTRLAKFERTAISVFWYFSPLERVHF
jgi:hypothetical protein